MIGLLIYGTVITSTGEVSIKSLLYILMSMLNSILLELEEICKSFMERS